VVVGNCGERFKFAPLMGTEADATEYSEEQNDYQQTSPLVAASDDTEARARLQT